MLKKVTILGLSILIGLVSISGCTQQDTDNTISIESLSYNPNSLTITIGETVKWINNDNVDHTVTADGLFDSGTLSNGETFEYTFNEAGTYEYTCTIHPNMQATITVEE
jgi:plastocyanin